MEKEELAYAEYRLEIFENLPSKAKALIFLFDNLEFIDYIENVQYCKSPIESILFVTLKYLIKKYELTMFDYIDPQHEIQINDKKYYADFCIEYDEILNRELKVDFKLVIECDGYEFHQKTKEQVEKDNQREYDLKVLGYDILRFSGREIYNNPIKCAKNILIYIYKKNFE